MNHVEINLVSVYLVIKGLNGWKLPKEPIFAIYITEDGKRTYETIPLNVVIEREKQGLVPVPDRNEKGDKLLFWLSPNDLVYLPTEEEREFGRINEPIDRGRIYKMVVPVIELGSNNKAQRAWTNEMIKDICIPIKVDRLGHIIEVKYRIDE